MKLAKFGAMLLALAVMLALVPSGVSFAQSPAYNTQFTTSITYQNVGSAASEVSLNFYVENTAEAIPVSQPDLPAGAGTSIFVGSLSEIDASFQGSAVLASSQPIVATLVQVPQNSTTVKNRPLSNGFDGSQGQNTFLVPTTLKQRFNTNTVFSVQNVGSAPVTGTVKFYNADAAGALTHTENITNLPAGSAQYFDLNNIGAIPANFNGSAVIEVNGPVVASALELGTGGSNINAASSFEGVPNGGSPVYMATALCQSFGGTTSYAVQNTGAAAADVTVTYSNGTTATKNVGPGAKASFVGCDSLSAGFSGSATITSGQPIVAIGKVFGSTASAAYSTAFAGATAGADTIALPYVRWSQTQFETGARQRAFIAIQNVGPAAVTGVTVNYRNSSGNIVCSDTIDSIAPGAKANSNPFIDSAAACAEFGYNPDGTFGGGATIEGPDGSQLVAIVRIQSKFNGVQVAEDYNGTPIQ
jgi:hypothetical protein